jgi:glycosyltransferase involved in cell wall biosynthesis
MKVLIIPQVDRFGGTLTFFRRLILIHREQQFSTAVLLSPGSISPELKTFLDASKVETYIRKFPSIPFWIPFLPAVFDLLSCLPALRKFRPDLVVVSVGTTGALLSPLLLPVPGLMVMHGYPTQRQGRFVKRLFRLAASKKNAFVSVSKFAASEITRRLGLPSDRIGVIHNPYTHPRQVEASGRKDIVLTLGHVVWYKNPEIWLAVARKVVLQRPDICFTWVGDGDMLEKMRASVREDGLDGAVIFRGFDEDVEMFYHKAAVYFQPSILESQGISVVDAMARGIPCVTSNAGGLPEVVIDGQTGYVSPPDGVDAFAENILRLIGDAALRDEMGSAGRYRATTVFSPVIQEDKFLDLYSRLIRR